MIKCKESCEECIVCEKDQPQFQADDDTTVCFDNFLQQIERGGVDLPPDTGLKFDGDKPMMQFLDPKFQLEIAKVFTFGAKKYGANNYKNGIHLNRILAAADRHLSAFKMGEDLDHETGLVHLAHAAACLQMAYYMWDRNTPFDDRKEYFQ